MGQGKAGSDPRNLAVPRRDGRSSVTPVAGLSRLDFSLREAKPGLAVLSVFSITAGRTASIVIADSEARLTEPSTVTVLVEHLFLPANALPGKGRSI